MKKQEMKQLLREIAKPVKKELFQELDYTEEELKLMKFLYLDQINQGWVSDELGISIPTLTKIHNNCIAQLISYFNYQKYKKEHNEQNTFDKFFQYN